MDHSQGMFKEFSAEEQKYENGQIIVTQKTVQGFFVDDDKRKAIISNVANPELIPAPIKKHLENLIDVEYLYEGLEYLLVKAQSRIHSFGVHLFQETVELIRVINLYNGCKIRKYQTNDQGSILVLNTDESRFLISGNSASDTIESEREFLTSRLELAKPFFEFKAIRKVDWTKLKDDKGDTFEKLIETLLPLENNILDVKPIGKTNAADRGRDFIVLENVTNTFGQKVEKKWLVQCKYSETSISPKTVPDWVNRIVEHGANGYWLITNNDLTPSLFDQLNEIPKNEHYKFETKFWQRNTFDIKLATRPEVFASEFFFNK
jgi:hypothetical protein